MYACFVKKQLMIGVVDSVVFCNIKKKMWFSKQKILRLIFSIQSWEIGRFGLHSLMLDSPAENVG